MNDYYKTIKKIAKMIMKERSEMEDYEKYDFKKERLVTYKKGYLFSGLRAERNGTGSRTWLFQNISSRTSRRYQRTNTIVQPRLLC